MLWHKIIDFDEAPAQFYTSGFYTHLGKIDAERAVENRLDQTSSPGVLVENESGLKIFLEKIIINGEKSLYCTRIALDGLSSFNELFGHDGADEVLRRTIEHIFKGVPGAENVHIFRTGADWSLVFTGNDAANLQAQALSWLHDQKNTLTVEKGKRCIVSTLSFQSPLNEKLLNPAFTVINSLRPGRSTIGESLQSMAGLVSSGKTDLLHTVEVPLLRLTGTVTDYRGPQKDYTPQFVSQKQAQVLDTEMQAGSEYKLVAQKRLAVIQERLEKYMALPAGNVSILNSEEYLSKYRLEGSYVFMENDKTMFVPITNTFGEVVFAVKIILLNPVVDWNNAARIIKGQINRPVTYRVSFDNEVLSEFRKAPINEALDELMYLRKYDPLFGLLEPSGRTMYFGRTVEPYVNYLRGLGNTEIENIVNDITKPLELRAVAGIILRDGFVLLRCGGEEFVVVARDKKNNWFTMSYDYNKFSRFGTTFGEAASDMYMQSSAGIMQYELKQIITAHYAKGFDFSTPWLADTLQNALRRMTNREIKYELSADLLDKELRTKSGKKIYAVHEKGEWYLFAADTEKELRKAILNSKLSLESSVIDEFMRRAISLNPLKINTVLSVMNNNVAGIISQEKGSVFIDLNKILGINPKAVFTHEPIDEEALKLHPGILLQGVLRGLSLSGGVLAWDLGLTLNKAIMVSDTIAEHAKMIVNQQNTADNEQTTIIDHAGQVRLLDRYTGAVYFGIKALFE